MQDFIKNIYSQNIATIERQIATIKQNAEREIAQEKANQERGIINEKNTEYDKKYSELAETIRKETENKLQDARKSTDTAKQTFREQIYSQVEADINKKYDLEIYELEKLMAEFKEKLA